MNNKILVHASSLHFFKKYQQPIEKFWLVAVPVLETVCIFLFLFFVFQILKQKYNLFIFITINKLWHSTSRI